MWDRDGERGRNHSRAMWDSRRLEQARHKAAQLWCLPVFSSREMDADFAEAIAVAMVEFADGARADGLEEAARECERLAIKTPNNKVSIEINACARYIRDLSGDAATPLPQDDARVTTNDSGTPVRSPEVEVGAQRTPEGSEAGAPRYEANHLKVSCVANCPDAPHVVAEASTASWAHRIAASLNAPPLTARSSTPAPDVAHLAQIIANMMASGRPALAIARKVIELLGTTPISEDELARELWETDRKAWGGVLWEQTSENWKDRQRTLARKAIELLRACATPEGSRLRDAAEDAVEAAEYALRWIPVENAGTRQIVAERIAKARTFLAGRSTEPTTEKD